MRFYTQQHRHYCGIDLHARQMYLCVLDAAGAVLLSRNIACTPQAFLSAVKAYRDDLVVAVECMFTWYWLADLCRCEGIAFVLGHALYMRSIHGAKLIIPLIILYEVHDIARFPRVQDFLPTAVWSNPHASPPAGSTGTRDARSAMRT